MKRKIALLMLTSSVFLAACAPPFWTTSTYEQFPMNRGMVKKGERLIKVIALVPGEGDVADAVGIELAKRGFVIVSAASTRSMAAGIDFKVISDHAIPARRNLGEMDKLRQQLSVRGVDAFLVFNDKDFKPRQWRDNAYWQQASYMAYSTLYAGPGYFGEIASGRWANIENRAKSPSDAAVEIVNSMAMGGGSI
ncbi:MAG: hypothetical protein AB7E73_15555 [Burkholderiales bacterium]